MFLLLNLCQNNLQCKPGCVPLVKSLTTQENGLSYRLRGLRFWGLWQSKRTSRTVNLLLTWTVLPRKRRDSWHGTWTCCSRGPSMPTLYTAETMATLKASAQSSYIFLLFSFFLKSKLSASTDLSYKDFRQALQGFTPPSLWGAQLQTPTGAGMERIGGLHQARQLLMDIILLPAKVRHLLCTKRKIMSTHWNYSLCLMKTSIVDMLRCVRGLISVCGLYFPLFISV